MAVGEEQTRAKSDPDVPMGEQRHRWRRLRRVRGRLRRHRLLEQTWRLVVLIVGLAVVLAGVIMLVAPGPGWVGIIVGFAILATEFSWAERWLARAKRMARKAAENALDPKRRRRNIVLTVIALIVAGLAGWWYVAAFGWPAVVVSAWERVLSWF